MTNYFYAYGRASTAKQVLGIEAQEQKLKAYFDMQGLEGIEWGGFTSDKATSGTVRFVDRANGGTLNELLRPGDHIAFAKADRAFRRLSDMVFCCDMWIDKGVLVHVLDWNVDTRTSVGRLVLNILACVAEFERCRIVERTTEALAIRRTKPGYSGRTHPAYGFKATHERGRFRIIPDPDERKVMGWIAREYMNGTTWGEMFDHLRENRILTRKGKLWSVMRIRRACAAEFGLQATEQGTKLKSPPSVSTSGTKRSG
jgi:DNA invertase Pin-like site-specific DNA recombinase